MTSLQMTGPTGSLGVGVRYVAIQDDVLQFYYSDGSVRPVPIVVPSTSYGCLVGPTGVGVTGAHVNACGDLMIMFDNGTEWPGGKIPPPPPGPTGYTGALGPTGPRAVATTTTAVGTHGVDGPVGPTGPQGPSIWGGPIGHPGPSGAVGQMGPMGPMGATGQLGPRGPTSQTGADGAVGPTGQPGAAGVQGAAASTGATGAAGWSPTGAAGVPGVTGAPGAQGVLEAYVGSSGLWGAWDGPSVAVDTVISQLRQPECRFPVWLGATADEDASTTVLLGAGAGGRGVHVGDDGTVRLGVKLETDLSSVRIGNSCMANNSVAIGAHAAVVGEEGGGVCIGAGSKAVGNSVVLGGSLTCASRPNQFFTVRGLAPCASGTALWYSPSTGQIGPVRPPSPS